MASKELPPLTQGALKIILESHCESLSPKVQILGSKLMADNNKIRCVIYDGMTLSQHCMLINDDAGQLYHEGKLSKFTVIQLNEYTVNTLPRKEDIPVILVKKFSIVMPGNQVNKKIDLRNEMEDELERYDPELASKEAKVVEKYESTTKVPYVPSAANRSISEKGSEKAFKNSEPKVTVSRESACPINVLTPYINNWAICGLVINKGPLRTYTNKKGEGRLFNFEMCDETGEIRITCFNEECDRFFDMIEMSKMYLVGKGTIKAANRKYSSVNNDYEITLNSQSFVQLVEEKPKNPPKIRYKFIDSLSEIAELPENSTVDVIAVIHTVNDVEKLTSKKTSKELIKRDIEIVDESKSLVRLTLWGDMALNFDGKPKQVIALKGAFVGSFKGKTLSARDSTIITLDPDVPELIKLRNWAETLDLQDNFNELSKSGVTDNYSARWSPAFAAQITGQKLAEGDALFHTWNSTIMGFNRITNHLYKSCGYNNCQKKVTDLNDGLYTCSKCNRTTATYTWRMMLSVLLSDCSGAAWATVFQNNAEKMFGKTVDEIAEMYVNDQDAYTAAVNDMRFKFFQFRIITRLDSYNNEMRVRNTVFDVKIMKAADRFPELGRMINILQGNLPQTF